jgi:lipopolysaccharide transport system permease protein
MMMLSYRSRFVAYRDLLTAWTLRTIRSRYQQSILGGLWAIAQPAATALIFAVIFTNFIPVNTGNLPYVLIAFTALVPWTFFATGITDMVGSMVDNMSLVTKIYFPREVLPVASLLSRLMDFGISAAVVGVLMLLYQMPAFPMGWIFLPLILLIQLALMLGIGLMGAALNVFYRDMKHLFTLAIQLWLYASPVIYPASLVPERLQGLYFLNPMAGIIEAYRSVLLYEKLPGASLSVAAVFALIFLLLGFWFFKRVESQFADVL